MAELITELDEVIVNVSQFNADLEAGKGIVIQLRQFKHWYYIGELDQFGPSKFIGYKNMTGDDYNFGYAKSGVDTEKELKKWFRTLSEEDIQYSHLLAKLDDKLNEYGKSLRKNAKIHVLSRN